MNNSPYNTKRTNTSEFLSTPKTNKTLDDSKSPIRLAKIKKSRRRECTPVYSPPDSDTKPEKQLFYTDRKANISNVKINQRLSFDCNDERLSYLSLRDEIQSNQLQEKKNFMALIEESLNDVNENYYGHLSSQTTPDILFRNIFSDQKKENPELGSTVEGKQGLKDYNKIFQSMSEILSAVSMKNFNLLELMNTRVILINHDIKCVEISRYELSHNFLGIVYNVKDACFSNDSNSSIIYLPCKIFLSFEGINQMDNTQPNSRLIFELNEENNIFLSTIEVHLFSM